VGYILPTMIVVGVTKMVGDWFGKAGIADRYLPLLLLEPLEILSLVELTWEDDLV